MKVEGRAIWLNQPLDLSFAAWSLPFIFLCCFLPAFGDDVAMEKYCTDGVCHTPGNVGNTTTVNQTSFVNNASPTVNSNLIGIQLSQTCITLERQHMNSSCLSYKDLLPFDNTNKWYAGGFTDTPWFHRMKSPIPNFYEYGNKTVVMVDPSAGFTTKARMIIVNEGNLTYINDAEGGIKGGLGNIYHVDLRMDNCNLALVAPRLDLINSTLQDMVGGCAKTTFNNTRIDTHPDIPWDTNNPYSTLLADHYLKTLFHGHSLFTTGNNSTKIAGGLGIGNCIFVHCKLPPNPYHAKGFGWG